MRTTRVACLLGIVAAAGCATTAFTTSWRNPDIKPASLDGRTVVALVMTTHEATRRGAEDTLASEISARGAKGVAAWTILPTPETKDEDTARAALTKAGATAVMSMEVVARTREVSRSNFQVRWRSSNHRSFWPHYRWAWGVAWSPPPPPQTEVWIETLVYSLDPDELIWAGISRTANASSTSALFSEVASAAGRQLERAGLLTTSAAGGDR